MEGQIYRNARPQISFCGRCRFICIFPVSKSGRLEMISYFESLVRNSSNRDFVISGIWSLITALCVFPFAEYIPLPFYQNTPLKYWSNFRSSLISSFGGPVSSAKGLLCSSSCTQSRTAGVGVEKWWMSGVYTTPPCKEGHPRAGDFEAIEIHTCHPRAPTTFRPSCQL